MAKEEKTDGEEVKAAPSMMKAVIIAAAISTLLGGVMMGGMFFVVSGMHAEQLAAVMAVASGAEGEGDVDGDSDGDGDGEASAPTAPPKYHSMDPKFVVSFSNQNNARFMQFSIDIMSREDEVIKQVEKHMPVIRSSLLMLFGSQDYEVMVTRAGKEKLLLDAVEDINTILQTISGATEKAALVEAAYFDSFVIQ